MTDDTRQTGAASVPSLLQALMADAGRLVRHELELARHEIQLELTKARSVLLALGLAIGLVLIGVVLLLLTLVHGLAALTGMPLWVSYAVIGGLFMTGSVVLLWRARTTTSEIHMVPPKTIETLKEHAAWIKEHASNRI